MQSDLFNGLLNDRLDITKDVLSICKGRRSIEEHDRDTLGSGLSNRSGSEFFL
jgi:hypothetical protein